MPILSRKPTRKINSSRLPAPKSSRITLWIAIIGCVTGVASVSWQVIDEFAPPVEKFSLQLRRISGDPTDLPGLGGPWRLGHDPDAPLYLFITNTGKTTLYFYTPYIEFKRKDQEKTTLFDRESFRPDSVQLKSAEPGEIIHFTIGPFHTEYLQHLANSYDGATITVSTTRSTKRSIAGFHVLVTRPLLHIENEKQFEQISTQSQRDSNGN